VGIATLDFVIWARIFFSSTSSSKSDAADKLHLLVLGTAPLAARRSESAKTEQDYLYETNQVASVHPRPSSKVQASRKGRKNKGNVDRFYYTESRRELNWQNPSREKLLLHTWRGF
jgi:hypothetical protein